MDRKAALIYTLNAKFIVKFILSYLLKREQYVTYYFTLKSHVSMNVINNY